MSTTVPSAGASKSARQAPLLAVGLALAIGAVIYSWRASNPSPAHTVRTDTSTVADEAASVALDDLAASVRQHVQDAATPLDTSQWPTRVAPPPEPVQKEVVISAETRTLRLKGIARHGSDAVAFIEDSTLAVGESIAGHRVLEIGDEQVVLANPDGERVTLRLYEKR
ncbi:MAG TPA: hypothetical protein PKE12_06080 [Kiritimatiellia bacterium]|nr:hypothetical protein [Kiritimatiellia bacterium]